MITWRKITKVKPTVSKTYRVKTSFKGLNIQYAYYNVELDTWIYDDGSWLPMDVTNYVTHWAELKEQ